MQTTMQQKRFRGRARVIGATLIVTLLVALAVTFSVGFRANPAPQPQRVSALVARIDALEEENANQQAMLDDLVARVEALEGGGERTAGPHFSADVTIPRSWVKDESSDGVLHYWHDPRWELASDEPGSLDLWLDEDTALFFTWDWASDLLDELHDDEEFLHFFEKDLLGSDEGIHMDVVSSDALRFMGADAHYWEVRVTSLDGFASRMLTVFYPCSDRTSCNVIFVRFDPDAEDDEEVPAFTQEDWDFINTFAHGVEFLTEGKATLTANANVRACPSTDCEVVERLVRGEIVEIVAITDDGLWYQLQSGGWIAAGLVDGAPDDLPVLDTEDEI